MEMKDVKCSLKVKRKVININLKISKEVSIFLKNNELSPTLIFDNAIKELMSKTH